MRHENHTLLLPSATVPAGPAAPCEVCCAVVRALNVPAFVHAGDQLLCANEALGRLLGQSEPELQQRRHESLAVPDMQERMRQQSEVCLRLDPEPAAIEVDFLTSNGETRCVELTVRRLDIGSLHLVLSTCQDLSDIRHVQTSLLNMSQVLNQILDSNPVATFVIDQEHRVTHWNKACGQLTGRDYWDMQGESEKGWLFYGTPRPLLCDLIVDGTDEATILNGLTEEVKESALCSGAYEAEAFFPTFGANGRWLALTAAPLRNAQGKVVGAIETLQDVTQRRLAEQELTQHRNELERLVQERTAELASTHQELSAFMENASVGILAAADGRISCHNKKFAEMFLTSSGSAVGRLTSDFFRSQEDERAFERIAYPRLARALPFQHEMSLRREDGKALWVQLIGYVSDKENPSAGAWWLLQDRSEMKRAHEALESNYAHLKEINHRLEEAQNQLLQSEKMASIGQLAAGVVHEINNPVGFVNSNLSSLKRYVDDLLALIHQYEHSDPQLQPEMRQTLAQAKAEMDLDYIREDLPVLLRESAEGLGRVKRIVQDLKDFSRVDSVDWSEADLNAGLDSTLNVVFNEVKYKAEVVKHYAALPMVRCLAGQLNQVFLNLIVNAAHAIETRGVITLSTGVRGDWVWVEVADNGCGMSEAVMRRVFDPFYTTKPVGKGTGLGLSLSFSIVQKHGGAIRVASAVGQGSRFRVWVPLHQGAGEAPLDFDSAGASR